MRPLMEFAARHHGLFPVSAATAAGADKDQIGRAIASGSVERVHLGVYRFLAVPPTWESDVLAACWAGGRRAFASHRTSAEFHELPGGWREGVEITCPRWRRARHDGLIVHESNRWGARDQTVVSGIPVATVPLTLLQLASCVPRPIVERALENALRRRLTSLEELDSLLARFARRGRPGIRVLRSLVQHRDPRDAPTESERETFLLQAIRRGGLAEPVRQFTVYHRGRRLGRVDLAYPDVRIAIEYDSDQFHTGRVATAADSRRRHEMIAAGWLPITAVNADLQAGGQALIAALKAALRDRRSPIPASIARSPHELLTPER